MSEHELKLPHLNKIEQIVYEVLRELSHEGDKSLICKTDFLKDLDVNFLKKIFSYFSLKVFERKDTPTQEFRIYLRKNLIKEIEEHLCLELSELVKADLINLSLPPAQNRFLLDKKIFSSVSHSPQIGGFSVCHVAHGFDTEQVDRCELKILKRVSSEVELAQMPDNAHLWSAKEAAFKCLSQTDFKIQVVAEAQITNWINLQINKLSVQFFQMTTPELQFNNLNHFLGISFTDNNQVYSFCFCETKII